MIPSSFAKPFNTLRIMKETNKTYEVCPHCEQEVKLDAELKVQTCPNCGRSIVTCSMCLACDTDKPYCVHCCLQYQAMIENKEKGMLDDDDDHSEMPWDYGNHFD